MATQAELNEAVRSILGRLLALRQRAYEYRGQAACLDARGRCIEADVAFAAAQAVERDIFDLERQLERA